MGKGDWISAAFKKLLIISIGVAVITDSVVRKFNSSDGRMLVKARLFASQYAKDRTAFETKSPKVFTSDFLDEFNKMINEAYRMHGDEEIRQDLAKETADISSLKRQIRDSRNNICLYIDLAIEDERIRNKLHLDGLSKLMDKNDSFLLAVTRLAVSIREYDSELIEQGCTEEDILEFENLCSQLSVERDQQENYKINRTFLTRERVRHLNAIYALMVRINNTAKVIWKDDREYAMRYALPKAASKSEDMFNEAELEAEIEVLTHEFPAKQESGE